MVRTSIACDPRGVLSILLALAVGSAGMTVVLGSWVAVPQPGQLPPDMHIGPVSWVLVLAGLAFGAGMSVSGSCISAHWYRLGEAGDVAGRLKQNLRLWAFWPRALASQAPHLR